jgi:hypothetical protein
MGRNETAFVVIVVVFAVVFCALSLGYTKDVFMAWRAQESALTGAAGKARTVNVKQIRELIRQGSLSSHEAVFYRKLPEGTAGK